jgi:eukaryotic-like serine/threonine-protein kinase
MISLDVGRVIAGKYRLERPLAQGGMGALWVARHLQLDTDVAVKLMASAYSDSVEARTRFEREAKACAQLRSPHVVQVHDYGVEEETPFLVMELLEGEDLGALIRRRGRLTVTEAVRVLVPVCKALRRAHEAGVVHRDIKPSNIFLARTGDDETVKVLDFGVAKVKAAPGSGAGTRAGVLLGSPNYMSPEQVRSKGVDHRSDLWSVGVVFFQAVTGQLPFPGEEVGDVLVEICTDDIPVPSQLVADLDPAVDALIARAMMRDMSQRFQSARELGQALTALPSDFVDTGATSSELVKVVNPSQVASGHVAPQVDSPSSTRVISLPVTVVSAGLPAPKLGISTTLSSARDEILARPRAKLPRRPVMAVVAIVSVVAIVGVAAAILALRRTSAAPPSAATGDSAPVAPPGSSAPDGALASAAPQASVAVPPSAAVEIEPAQPTSAPSAQEAEPVKPPRATLPAVKAVPGKRAPVKPPPNKRDPTFGF